MCVCVYVCVCTCVCVCVCVCVYMCVFADAIRTMTKYKEDLASLTLDAKIDRHLKECRGQRNFYITGFALFLIL